MEKTNYIEQGEEGFQIHIPNELETIISGMAWKNRKIRITDEAQEYYVYNFYMTWLILGDGLPQIEGLPTFDRKRIKSAYFNGFRQGFNEFQRKYGDRYVSGNGAFIANLKRIYEGDLKYYRTSIPAIYNKRGLELTGKNCGMLYGLEQLAKDYPEDFKEFFMNESENWNILHKGLINKYIKDVSLNDFNVVMNFKQLPIGKSKIVWIGKKNEAMFFQKWNKFEVKEFNQCFIHVDGKPFAENHRGKNEPRKFKKYIKSLYD